MKNLTGKIFRLSLILIFLLSYYAFSQNPVQIQVNYSQSLGHFDQFWGGVGQDSFNDGILEPHNQATFDLMRDLNNKLQKTYK